MSVEREGGWSGEECLLFGATVMRNGPGWCLETSTGFLSSPGGLLSMAPPGASAVRQQGLCYFFFFVQLQAVQEHAEKADGIFVM